MLAETSCGMRAKVDGILEREFMKFSYMCSFEHLGVF